MKTDLKFFKNSKSLPVDKFFRNVLYDKKFGYYNSKNPFGKKGDFITAPKISNLFSEMIAIWIISTWEMYGKPKKINVIELGPGDGVLISRVLKVFERFPEFNNAKCVYLYEKSFFLKNLQKKKIKNLKVKWINNLKHVKKGPVIFFGNEFFDAIPIKQFKREKNYLFEKNYEINKNFKIMETFKKASQSDIKLINSYKTLSKLKFIEFPKDGLKELNKIVKKILSLKGCILLIDYGYLKPNNLNTLQSVLDHKKNFILKNLGKADVTSNVNFALLNEFYKKKKLVVKKTVSQSDFLKSIGILERAQIISKKMLFKEQVNLFLRLKRLLSPRAMGNLFKVHLAFKLKNNHFLGFK